MAHAQKPDFVFRRNGRVHLNRQGRQFSRGVRISGRNAGYTKFRGSEGYWLLTPFVSFPFISPPVRHRVPSRFSWTLPHHDLRCSLWFTNISQGLGLALPSDIRITVAAYYYFMWDLQLAKWHCGSMLLSSIVVLRYPYSYHRV